MRNILIASLIAAMGARAGATVLVATDLGQLSHDAQMIARGHVVAVEGRWTDDRRTIETLVTLAAESYLKGQMGETVQFRVPGGTLGRFRSVVVGAPEFRVGQRVIVFLGANGPSVPFLVGLSQGVYRVARADQGDWIVTPSPVLPTVGPVTRGSPALRPAPLADFERNVRQLAEGGR